MSSCAGLVTAESGGPAPGSEVGSIAGEHAVTNIKATNRNIVIFILPLLIPDKVTKHPFGLFPKAKETSRNDPSLY